MSILKVKLVREGAQLPKRETVGSAGHDLRACIEEDLIIPAGEGVRLPTGIAIEMESAEYVAIIASRSSMAYKYGISMGNGIGVIDSDYRGEIGVGLRNDGPSDYTVQPGERIAQLMFMPCLAAAFTVTDTLDDTERGAGGFGSTGKM